MIYVDEAVDYPPACIKLAARRYGRLWCHMWAATPADEPALHALAERIGLRRQWYQRHQVVSHYDLTPAWRAKAIAAGAVERSMMSYLRERMQATSNQGDVKQ